MNQDIYRFPAGTPAPKFPGMEMPQSPMVGRPLMDASPSWLDDLVRRMYSGFQPPAPQPYSPGLNVPRVGAGPSAWVPMGTPGGGGRSPLAAYEENSPIVNGDGMAKAPPGTPYTGEMPFTPVTHGTLMNPEPGNRAYSNASSSPEPGGRSFDQPSGTTLPQGDRGEAQSYEGPSMDGFGQQGINYIKVGQDFIPITQDAEGVWRDPYGQPVNLEQYTIFNEGGGFDQTRNPFQGGGSPGSGEAGRIAAAGGDLTSGLGNVTGNAPQNPGMTATYLQTQPGFENPIYQKGAQAEAKTADQLVNTFMGSGNVPSQVAAQANSFQQTGQSGVLDNLLPIIASMYQPTLATAGSEPRGGTTIRPPNTGEAGLADASAQGAGVAEETQGRTQLDEGAGPVYEGGEAVPSGNGFPDETAVGVAGADDGTGKITPPNTGGGGLSAEATSPDGRTMAQIRAHGDYLSEPERLWFLNQIGKTLDAAGNVVPMSQPTVQKPAQAAPAQGQPSGGVQIPTNPGTTQPAQGNFTPQPGATILKTPNGHTATVNPDGSAQFQANIEQYRSAIAQVFPPEYVNAMLWIIAQESGGNPGANNGRYNGIFQSDAPGAKGDIMSQIQSAYQDKFLPSLKAYPAGMGLAPWGYNNPPVHGGASSLPAQLAPRRR